MIDLGLLRNGAGHAPRGRGQLRRLQQPQSPEEGQQLQLMLKELQQGAAEDGHEVLFPTHVFLRPLPEGGQEVVGYGSLAAMPVVNFWADSKAMHAAESLRMIEQGEAVCSQAGLRTVVTLCAEESPFAQHMERLGYRKLGKTVLYIKNL